MCSKKVFNSAPLPFMGQKRRFVKDFKEALAQFEDIDVVVDLFGGSGLLSHVAKHERPDARVIYNDFDYFCDRVANVKTTNEILSKIRVILKDAKPDKKVPEELRSKVLEIGRAHV